MPEVLQLLSLLTGDSRFMETTSAAEGGDEPKNMCEVLDRIENRGIEQGDLNRAKKVAFRLDMKGLPIEEIADVVETDINTVSSWIQGMSGDA